MRYAIVVMLSASLMLVPTAALTRDGDLRGMARVTGLDDADLRHLARGEIIAKTLHGTDSREIVALGAAVLPISRELFIRSLREDALVTGSTPISLRGRFGRTPDVADLDQLALDEGDLRDLRECRPERCKVYLPRDAVQTLVATRHTPGGTERPRLSAFFKAFLIGRLSTYQAGGRNALEPFAQRSDVNRTRVKVTAGTFGSIARRLIESRAREGLRR